MNLLQNIFNYFSNWDDRKIDKSPYISRKKEIIEHIQNSKKYADYLKVQQLNLELYWLKIVFNETYLKNLDYAARLNNHSIAENSKRYDSKDKELAQNIAYKKIKKNELTIPQTLSFENKLHYKFCEEIACDLEKDNFQAKKNNIFLEKNLSSPKEFTKKVLTFLHSYHTSGKDEEFMIQVNAEYFNELQLLLNKFE